LEIKLIDGSTKDLNLSEAAKAYFEDEKNCVSHMLDQIKDNYFKDIVLSEDKVILDIGSNIGLFALHFTPYAERIISVEPTKSHMAIQKEILTGSVCEFEESALGDKTGIGHFSLCAFNSTMNGLTKVVGDYTVNTFTLEDLCKKYELTKVDFCKIDIEGGEWLAITEETLKPVFNIIDKIFIEIHPPESRDRFKDIFISVGYSVAYHKCDGLICIKN
jgi:FkbM family methyltransferase